MVISERGLRSIKACEILVKKVFLTVTMFPGVMNAAKGQVTAPPLIST